MTDLIFLLAEPLFEFILVMSVLGVLCRKMDLPGLLFLTGFTGMRGPTVSDLSEGSDNAARIKAQNQVREYMAEKGLSPTEDNEPFRPLR